MTRLHYPLIAVAERSLWGAVLAFAFWRGERLARRRASRARRLSEAAA